MLSRFRNGSYPLDAFISDFGWYTPVPDYNLPPTGSPTFQDFTYNPVTFPDNGANIVAKYRDELHLRFGGIRKPRLGNSALIAMAEQKGWSVRQPSGGNGGPRNLNFSRADTRQWYHEQNAHFLPEGVEFWWNDEGETYYFNFYWWNVAQKAGLALYDAAKRFFTINRSFTPGMQRLGAATWRATSP